MKNTYLSLNSNETISDKIYDINSGINLVIAPTGTGKTTFVLEKLTKKYKILMLVPLVGQIEQLENKYQRNTSIKFISGKNCPSSVQWPKYQNKHIVATYDMWSKIQHHLDVSNYVLVIDEIHKLYSVGSYRDDALNPLLALVNNRSLFQKKLFLTATYTPKLGEIAQLVPDSFYIFEKSNSQRRLLTIKYSQDSGQYDWLSDIIDRLNNRSAKQKVLVRLNSNKRIDTAITVLETLGYKALKISRQTLETSPVKRILTAERLSDNYDVFLTSSVFDEAINLNNHETDIDSVHIVDASAHPEEIVQFMGRLRLANPPFFLHLKTDKYFLEKIDNISKANDNIDQMIEKKFQALSELSKSLSVVNELFNEKNDICLDVDSINNSISSFLDFDILWTDKHNKTVPNTAAILSKIYLSHRYSLYNNYYLLEDAITLLSPSIIVKKEKRTTSAPKNIIDLLDKIKEDQKQKEIDACSTVCDYIASQAKQQEISLHEYGRLINDEISQENHKCPFDFKKQKEEFLKYFNAITLTQHLSNIHHIKTVLTENQYHHIIKISESYKNNVFYNQIRSLLSKSFNTGSHINGPDARQIVLDALRYTIQYIPALKRYIKSEYYVKGFMFDYDKQCYDIAESKALNFIAKIADVEDKNSHKTPEKRYLIFRSIHYKSYTFINANVKPSYTQNKKIATQNIEEIFA